MKHTETDEVTQPVDEQAKIPLTEVSQTQVTLGERVRKWLRDRVNTFWVAWEDWRTKAGLSMLLVYVLMGTLGVTYVPEPGLSTAKWTAPFQTMEYPLGTNQFGEGIFAMIVHATPPMLKMVLGGAFFATSIGAALGIFSGYKGGRTDEVLMTLTDIAMMLPGLPLVIVIAAVYAPENPFLVGILVSINAWAGAARGLRSQVLTIREEAYVEASRIMNVPTWKILTKDVTPQLLPLILVNLVMTGRGVIYGAVGLYFLGVLPYSSRNWGVMLNDAYEAGAVTTPEIFYTIAFPLLTIVLFSWALIMLAQGLDRVVNVRVRAKHSEGPNE